MLTRNALLIMAAPAIALFLHCAGKPKRSIESAPSVVPYEVVEAGSDAEAGVGGAAAEEAPPRPDPMLVQKLVDRAAQSAPDEVESLGVRFEVSEMGPDAPWGMVVVNRGSEAVEVAFDPRLLVLEIEPPPDPNAKKWTPKPKNRICKLPDELRPSRVNRQLVVRLESGHGMVESFDVRLYCLPEQGKSPLVPGAKVSARFGWAPKTKTVWKKGKREEELLPQTEPFVATVAPPLEHEHEHEHGHSHRHDADDAGSNASDGGDSVNTIADAVDAGSVEAEHETGVKELHATRFELGSEYAAPKPETASREPLALELRSGSDAHDETQATVTLAIVNRSNRARYVYFRREFVSFEVSGPDGVAICDPEPDARAPDRVAYSSIQPGGSLTSTSRLVELCPDDTFARPGLYTVKAELNTFANGAEFGFDAFVGRLVSERSVVVRVRTGALPFPAGRVVEEIKVGSTPP